MEKEKKTVKITILITPSQKEYLNQLLLNSDSANLNQVISTIINKQMIVG